jgi:Nucleotidyltransferase of unknown function (DUF6036)
MEKMGEDDLRTALNALGERRRTRTDIVVGGAGALILTGELPRATSDFDVLYSDPDMGQLQEDIRAIADQFNLTPEWLNGSIQSYLDVLPPDYQTRLRTFPTRGNLHIALLHRQDVIVMKLFAGRPRDLNDVAVLQPTLEELDFVRHELSRLELIDPARSLRIQSFLDQA